MAGEASFMVKISGSQELVEDLERIARESAGAIEVKSAGPSQEPSHLKLGLGDVATIVAIMNGTVTLAKFAYGIYEALRQKRAQRVTIQTPVRTVEILASDATDEKRVRDLVEGSVRV